MSEKNILQLAALFGLATVALGVTMSFYFPQSAELADGFTKPILAFEFAKSESDLAFLTGDSTTAASNRAAMDAGHQWDMFFPIAYAGLLLMMLLRLLRHNPWLVRLGMLVTVAIVPLDIQENEVLLQITSALSNGESAAPFLADLYMATWLKWGAIGIAAGFLGCVALQAREWLSSVAGLSAGIGVLVAFLSGADAKLSELMSLLIFIFFVILTLKSWWLLRSSYSKKHSE